MEAAIVVCTLPGTTQRHALLRIVEDGTTRYYDRAFGCYRTDIGVVHYVVEDGPSRGSFDLIPVQDFGIK